MTSEPGAGQGGGDRPHLFLSDGKSHDQNGSWPKSDVK